MTHHDHHDDDFRHDDRFGELDSLSDWKLEHSSQDIRGYPLVSPTGHRYGKIDDMLVDKAKEHVAAVRLDDGRMCGVEYLDIKNDHVVYRNPDADYVPSYNKVTRHTT